LYVDLVDVVRDVRRLDARSDGVLAALVRRSPTDEWVASLVVVALLPLALARCRKGRAQVDELIGELAIAIGEAAIEGLEPSQRRVANCLLDRAWGRVRRPARRAHHPAVCDPRDLEWMIVDDRHDPADVAVQRADFDRTARWLAAADGAHRSTVRAWNTAVSLAETDERSPQDRARLKYARRVLRRSPAAVLAGCRSE